MDDFCGSPFWDWNLTWYTENPDFTPCFERTVITFVPCFFLWIFVSVDIFFSYWSPYPDAIPWSALNIAKMVLTSVLILLEAGMVVVSRVIPLNSITDYVVYPVDLYVPIIRAVTLLLTIVLLLYSKNHGVRSSGIQFLFWLLFSLSQAIRFRTVILQSQQHHSQHRPHHSNEFILEVVYFPIVLGQFILHCWADVAPSYQSASLKDLSKPSTAAPELRCSFLSKFLFEWFTPLTWKGFRKPLEYSDLWELNPIVRCCNSIPRFDKYWPTNLNGTSHGKPTLAKLKKDSPEKGKYAGSVLSTLFKAYGLDYLFGFCIRIVPDLVIFVSPQILNLLINFTGSPDEPTWKGILYSSILLVTALISCIFAANGSHLFYQIGCSMKSALVSAVYRKSLLLSNSARRDQSTGEIVNRMAVDVVYMSEFTQTCNLIITTPLIIGIALYFLWNILGVAALAGVGVMVLLLPLNAFLASRVQKLQKEQMAYKDKRTKLMSEILSGMKVIKLYAWEPSFEKLVGEIREKELMVLKKTAYWNAVANFLSTCAPFLVAIGSFGTYVLIDSENVLDATTAFVSLSLFNIMNQPLTFMPILISNFIQAAVGAKRVNTYMNADEIDLDGVSHNPSEPNPIAIENGSFAWEVEGRVADTLQNINLQVRDGQLVAIVGPVGSGKSSLLSALLNELVKTEGRVNIRGTIAYVAQQAWIQNATVRDNILFGKPYEPIRYKKVVEACALKPDLEILPAGDKTEIGEKGINLSGGQKQRIALARAVYSNAEIYLLDDPLSAVDAHVGKHIFEKVVGPKGLLRKKTRLLVTHGIVYLPEMDNIVVMNNGHISETGSYSELQDKHGAFAEFLKSHTSAEETENVEQAQKAKLISKQKSVAMSDSESESSPHRRRLSTASVSSHVSHVSLDPVDDKLIEVEKPETQSVKASVYIDYFRSAGWRFTVATLIMYVIFQSFSVGANLWLSNWANMNTTENGYYLGIYGLLGFSQAVSILLGSLVMALGTVRSAKGIHQNSLFRILRAPLQFFDVTPTGRIINRFSRDVDSLDNILPIFLRFLLNGIFNVLAVIVVITISTPLFAVVIVPMGLAYYLVQRFYIATSRQLKRLESVSRSPIYSHFGETITGASTIRAYNQQERFIQELETRQDHNLVSYYYLVSSNRWLQIRLELMGNTVVFFAALFAVLARDTLSQGLVGLSVSYALQITMALLFVVRFTSDVENNIVAVERLKEYSECPQEAPWKVGMWKPPSDWPQEGKIEFENFQARYRPGLDLVLKGVSCGIQAGEKVGIVGRTGAGKSSVTLGIFRIIEAAGGKILVDGEDISRFGLHDVRGNITIIPQEPMLFSGTLKVNLDPFEEKRDEELWRALDLAHLRDFVRELPGGLNYEISEGGENLSVGQRQLVCLARALLRKTKILVLDEATSAVDLDTEELILKTIRDEFKHATVVTIAHRLNTIMDSDRVLVLEKGDVKEFDTPGNLLNNRSSIFYSMAKEAGVTSQSATRDIVE